MPTLMQLPLLLLLLLLSSSFLFSPNHAFILRPPTPSSFLPQTHPPPPSNTPTHPTKLFSSTTTTPIEGYPHGFEDVPREALHEIEEEACQEMLKTMRSWDVSVPNTVSSSGYARATGVGPRPGKKTLPPQSELPPVLLLHGFDSSCLEYRRLHPLLDQHLDTYALDMMGWGFSQLKGIADFSVEAKRAYLYGFWNDVMQRRPMVLVGASLGGAAAVDFAHAYPEAVSKLVLIDGQVYIDGVGQMSSLPTPIANLGIKVLKSKALRAYAGKLSYHNPERFSTTDAMNIGRVHTLREGWEEASVGYMLSGGFTTSNKVKDIKVPTLVLWGAQDQILEPKLYAHRFVEEMENAQLKFVENCGHVCHLEKPLVAAEEIVAFVAGREARIQAVGPEYGLSSGSSSSSSASSSTGGGWAEALQGFFGGATKQQKMQEEPKDCEFCKNERVVDCINCEGLGSYTTWGKVVQCSVCKGSGLMICKDCYNGDPEDIEGIRQTVRDAAVRLGRTPQMK